MVTYIKSDLEFILAQIKLAEAHAAGQPLYGLGGLIPDYNDSLGLRTVDGTFNNLLPGQERWGAADNEFLEVLNPVYRDAGEVIPLGPMTFSAPTYAPSDDPSNLVVDSSPRTISNLIVDQTLNNPSAILKGLEIGGVVDPDLANLMLVQAINDVFQPISDAEYQARVTAQTAQRAVDTYAGGDPAELQILQDAADFAAAEAATAFDNMIAARIVRDADLEAFGIAMDGDNVMITNVAPDEGLSASFNSWFTLFGQFFDHGLDLVNKGDSGTVFIPLQPDDPLYVEGSSTNFMVLTRATVSAGEDGIMGTADDVRPVNTTTPFVDQNQTYASHSSHQVFLRQYELNAAGEPADTGKLIEGGGASPGGMATWGEVKAQARDILGINLTDFDVGSVPLLRTDQYGNFIRDANGMPQIIVGIGADGIPNTDDDDVVSGDLLNPVDPTAVGALRTGHAFLADIAHDAVPFGKIEDGDIEIGLGNPGNGSFEYDNELLDAHFIAGDGRANENIGLTAVHSVFHTEHNRLVDHTKDVTIADARKMLADGATQEDAVAFLNEWLDVDVTEVPADQAAVDALVWDGDRLFQAAKFGTEMQYQHAVFEDFARKIQPNIDFFIVPDGYRADINPGIVAEFAHVVYRFGHSMLTEDIARLDLSFNDTTIGLIEGFLNPIAFDNDHTIADSIAAGTIVRGMTRQVGNEIDEFVTSALRNNLLGLPLDLATINLARGRDTGVPTLNAARRDFYEASQQAQELKPYESWTEFAGNLKNEASIINFIAAYGTHATITAATTLEAKRDAAMELVFGVDFDGDASVPADRLDFLNAAGAYAGGDLGGLENVDFWIGGLAEAIMPFGGMLGSTFAFIFEAQLEALQDGDRFYYLQRLDGLHLFAEMENNTLSDIIMRNFDVGHLPSDVFSVPGLMLEIDQMRQYNEGLGSLDPLTGTILNPDVVRDNPATAGPDSNYLRYNGDEHVLLGGTDNDDILIGSIGDDTLYGDAGNDRMEGGHGNDQFRGGAGDDIITDIGGDDIIRSGPGHDAINAGQGVDLVVADSGNDFIVLGDDELDEAFGGPGNDFILGGLTTEQSMGGEGDDWIEWGAWSGAVGDNFEQDATDSIKGHDVFHGLGGFDEFIGEGGDDIWVMSIGRGKFDGLSGFDWTSAADMPFGQTMDMNITHIAGGDNRLIDEYTNVEGASGSAFDDVIIGTDVDSTTILAEGFRGSVLDAEGIALIDGLQEIVGAGVTMFDGGNILLGGAGSDIIEGRGGDDIIDGDKWLNVRISVRESYDEDGPIGMEIDSADSMTQLSSRIFSGEINPGQLQIVREILKDESNTDIDVAVFSGNFDDYDISQNPDGSYQVNHTGGTQTDGNDRVSNIELLRFADVDFPITEIPGVSVGDVSLVEGDAGTTNAVFTVSLTLVYPEAVTVFYTTADGTAENPDDYQAMTGSIVIPAGSLTGDILIPVVGDEVIELDETFSLQLTGAEIPLFGGGTLDLAINDGNGTATIINDDFVDISIADVVVGEGETGTKQMTFTVTLSQAVGDAVTVHYQTSAGTATAGTDYTEIPDTMLTFAAGETSKTITVDVAGDILQEADETLTVTLSNNSPNSMLAVASAVGTILNDDLIGTTGVDNLVALDNGVTSGVTLDYYIEGRQGNDTLVGGLGNDKLNGGTGADQMNGGLGDDTYVVDSTSDVVTENAGEGTDTILNGFAYYVLGANIENLVHTAANNAIVIGNGLDNVLTGHNGNDYLEGGAGVDTMIGGLGNDRYFVNDYADTVVENAGEGIDIVRVTIANATYTLGDNIENLEFRGLGSSHMIGNDLDNRIEGNFSNDVLDGGLGADFMVGNNGNDTYYVDNVGDWVYEGSSAVNQIDTVNTTLSSYTLGYNVENLNYVGTGDFTGMGNTLNNVITGGDGNDVLDGGRGLDKLYGGAGNDRLIQNAVDPGRKFVDGGTGNDTFVLNGTALTENFTIYTRSEAIAAGFGAGLNAATEIVVTRAVGAGTTVVLAELANIQEIEILTGHNASLGVLNGSEADNPAPGSTTNAGGATGDNVRVVGDFTETTLSYNTITVQGGAGNDTVDISGLTSDHRLVFNSGSGQDQFLGGIRDQDEFNPENGGSGVIPGLGAGDNVPEFAAQAIDGGLGEAAAIGQSAQEFAREFVALQEEDQLMWFGALNGPESRSALLDGDGMFGQFLGSRFNGELNDMLQGPFGTASPFNAQDMHYLPSEARFDLFEFRDQFSLESDLRMHMSSGDIHLA